MKADDEVMYPDNGQVELLSKQALFIFLACGVIVFAGMSSFTDVLLGWYISACLDGFVCAAILFLFVVVGVPRASTNLVGSYFCAYLIWAFGLVNNLNYLWSFF